MRVQPDQIEPVSVEKQQLRQKTWLWALLSCTLVVLVVGGAVAAHQVAATVRRDEAIVQPPALPPLSVVAATQPDMQLAALDTSAHHLVTLVSDTMPSCPPIGPCPPVPTLKRLDVLDGATGAALAATPLTGPASTAAQSQLLLVDSSRHLAYAVSERGVTVFSSLSGVVVTNYALPPSLTGSHLNGGVLDAQRDLLVLAAGQNVAALRAGTGALVASHALAGVSPEGPVLDAAHGLVLFLMRAGAVSRVDAFDDASLTGTGYATLPAPVHLGPLDAATGTLYTPASGDAPCQYDMRPLLTGKSVSGTATALTTSSHTLCSATSFGWDGTDIITTGNTVYARLRSAATGLTEQVLPFAVAWSPEMPLLADSTTHLFYLPALDGRILFVRAAAQGGNMTSGTAVALANAALRSLLPDTNQDPPFVAPQTFPSTSGMRSYAFWIHFSDRGWQGPYPGTAETRVSVEQEVPGAYLVTFRIRWQQLFERTHSWVCEVRPDGSVRLKSSTGDALP